MRFKKLAAAALAAALGAAATGAAAQTADDAAPGGTRARSNLASYVSDGDYPKDAIARREEGTVGFRLDVDATGQVSGCTILSSSGSALLDSATCRIMRERARFQPATDAQGRPVPDSVTSRMRWVLPVAKADPEITAAYQASYLLWMNCALGAAAKLATSTLPARTISEKALAQCAELEQLAARHAGTELALIPLRNDIRRAMDAQLDSARRALGVTAKP